MAESPLTARGTRLAASAPSALGHDNPRDNPPAGEAAHRRALGRAALPRSVRAGADGRCYASATAIRSISTRIPFNAEPTVVRTG